MNMAVSAMVMNLILFAPIVMALWYKKKGTLTTKTICMLLIFMGVILRMIYVFHTDIKVRQYDVHVFFSGHEGHSEYIEYIYNNLKLPDFDPREKWQFYHPPLHHILCAVWLKMLNLIGIKIEFGVSTLQYLTVIYSTLFSVFSYKIFKRLEISETALITVIAIVTFHPTMIYLSGSINNDMLSSLFAIMAIYYTVKWSQDKKLFDIVKLGLSIGLGMFTKLTVGLIAPAVAVVFLIVFIKNIKQWKKYIAQFALFAVVCCPLGLYWYIRNYIRFGVPLNYVPKLATQSPEFINKPLEYRLMDWSLRQFASPFKQLGGSVEGYLEYNPFVALLKTSMFVDDTF
ncbi:MAG: glycosyltransferase family 39 protein, partial [Lachnospiraceae bacterium]|nr:glycosyltransferase family 39 protein [Lachnospiraceae bacterium]